MPTYSLSSATADAACSTCKTKKASAQLGRLIGLARSRVSSEDSRRGVSEDGRIEARSINDRMSKAAAWMWHTRGISDAAVVPTKQLPAVNASSIINNSKQAGPAALSCASQPSRFKREASTARLAYSDLAASASPTLAHDSVEGNSEERPSAKVYTVNDLYDEFELSRLQELVETEIDKRHSKLSAQPTCRPCAPSSTISSPYHQIKPLSAIHKLLKQLYTSVHNIHTRSSAVQTGPPSTGQFGPRKLRSVQHVIHHHHHHYHHYRSSLDLPAHDRPPYHEPTHIQEFVRRRRHSYQSYSLDHLVDDSLYTEDSAQSS